jgi:hypothetical protein
MVMIIEMTPSLKLSSLVVPIFISNKPSCSAIKILSQPDVKFMVVPEQWYGFLNSVKNYLCQIG